MAYIRPVAYRRCVNNPSPGDPGSLGTRRHTRARRLATLVHLEPVAILEPVA